MKIYLLKREQWVPLPIEDVFAFFSDAANLEEITPPWLEFRILTPGPIAPRAGTRIAYRLRWHGVPLRWVTTIRDWSPPTGFVDEQTRGPYRLWHHTHTFQPLDGGTLLRDAVRYALPLGPLGRLAQAAVVGADLEAIFDYRAERVAELMGQLTGQRG